MKFVYVVKIDITINGSTETEIKVFSTREKAEKYVEYYFSIYQDKDHCEIIKRMVY